jgi:putative CocE/NonD family hydrolase
LLPAEADARVKAVAVGQTFADLNQALNPNDCFKLSFATGIFALAYKSSASRTDDDLAVRWGASFYTDTEDVPIGPFASTTEDLRARSPLTHVSALVDRRVPVFWAQAWEDQLFPGDHPERILEPLDHAGVPIHYWFSSGGHAAAGDFPAEVAAREGAMLDWLDEFLRGADHGFGSGARPKVDYWQRISPGKPGEWVAKTASDWPLPEAHPLRLYLDAGRALREEPSMAIFPVGRITNDLVSANLANDPIVNEIDNQARARGFTGIGDTAQRVPESQNPVDSAMFATGALTGDVEITGAPQLSLGVSTTATRVAQFAPKVWDEAPDGTATLVSRGCASFEGPKPAESVALWPNSHVFPAGHRIVLTVSAVDFPTFKPDTEPQQTNIFNDSHLDLPVLSG